MTISITELEEFQVAYKKDFGEDISIAEARETMTRLVNLLELIYRPLPGEVVTPWVSNASEENPATTQHDAPNSAHTAHEAS